MADEDLDLEDETPGGDEAQEPAPQQDASYWKVRAEKAERKAKRTEAYLGLQSKYPGVTMEDLAGVDVRHWERIASRLAAATPPAEEPKAPEPETPAPSAEAVEAAKAFTAGAGGSGPAVTQTITFAEAKARGGLSNPDIAEMARKGLVEGVKPPK